MAGIIQDSNSSITLKDDDGSELILTVLKHPISLDDLKYEEVARRVKKVHKAKAILGLDKNLPITFDVSAVKRLEPPGRGKKRKVDSSYETWKQHTMTIFQNSSVYPFVLASNKYKCFICSKLFLEPLMLRNHTIKEHTLQDMDRELDNKAHDMNLKVDVNCLQCALCTDPIDSVQDLKLHLKYHGKDINLDYQDNIIPFKLGGETFQCQICAENYSKLRLLVVHMNTHFKNYSCEICGSAFITHLLLKRHLKIHESGSFPCEKCDKTFSNATKRMLHVKGVHLKQLHRRCPMCPERFSSNYQRTKHLRIVHNHSSGLYRCNSCGKEYDLKCHLLVHTRMVHLQEKSHECSMCHSRFFSRSVLARHMIIHTGDKKFKCGVCGKAYSRKSNLMEHTRTHECTICGLYCRGHGSLE